MHGEVSVGKPKGTRRLRRPGYRWEDNIRIDLRKIWWEIVNWIKMTQDRDQWQ